jgi:hypothetical protein
MYPFHVQVFVKDDATTEEIVSYDATLQQIAAEKPRNAVCRQEQTRYNVPEGEEYRRKQLRLEDSEFVEVPTLIFYDGSFRFDASGTDEDASRLFRRFATITANPSIRIRT